MKRIPLLSLDGGGFRAFWQQLALREITKRLGVPLSKIFKNGLIGGVSGGGINTCGIVHPDGLSSR